MRAVPVMTAECIVEEKGSAGIGPTREYESVAAGLAGSTTSAEFHEIVVLLGCVIVSARG